MKRLFALVAAGAVFVACAAPASAAPMFTVTNTSGVGLGNPPFTLGFQFTATQTQFITALGLFDGNQNGLVNSYQLGLWNSSGTLLATATLGSGTSGSLVNQFRYTNINPVQLQAGQTYQIGALFLNGADDLLFPGMTTGFATAPGITFNQATFAFGATLSNPVFSGGGQPAYFGPNALLSPIPEPATLAVFGVLAAGAFGIRRRMRA